MVPIRSTEFYYLDVAKPDLVGVYLPLEDLRPLFLGYKRTKRHFPPQTENIIADKFTYDRRLLSTTYIGLEEL